MSEATPKVTSIDELKARAVQVVELPGWTEGDTFFARMRRVGLINLVAAGHLPNELLSVVGRIMRIKPGENPMDGADEEDVRRWGQLLDAVARSALVEPSYDEIIEAAGFLTDAQLQAIFLYATQGVRILELFRKPARTAEEAGVHGESVGEGAE